MNNDIINNEHDLLCYRLRTERQRRRAVRKGFEKKLLKIDREHERLFRQKQSLGWIEINPPVMRGWKRYFVLRPDIERSKDAAFFQGLLDKINTIDYSTRKDFKVKYRSKGKKMFSVTSQRLRYAREVDFKKVSFTEKEWAFFEERDVPDWTGKKFYKAFVFTEPWRFVLRVRPNIIYETRVKDVVIESRLSEINNYLESRCLNRVIFRLKGYSNRYWKGGIKEKEKYIYSNMSLSQILSTTKAEVYKTASYESIF